MPSATENRRASLISAPAYCPLQCLLSSGIGCGALHHASPHIAHDGLELEHLAVLVQAVKRPNPFLVEIGEMKHATRCFPIRVVALAKFGFFRSNDPREIINIAFWIEGCSFESCLMRIENLDLDEQGSVFAEPDAQDRNFLCPISKPDLVNASATLGSTSTSVPADELMFSGLFVLSSICNRFTKSLRGPPGRSFGERAR